jgi:hypothetical protein
MKKNIHILETNQPSRLGYISESKTYHLYNNDVFLDELANTINIYITSDEEIKEGDWCYDKVLNLIFQTDSHTDLKYVNQTDNVLKIILTTDPTLFADGVQEIDDEFLEWFVENPTCEFVEVKDLLSNNGNAFYGYEIIIPQEEPKQETGKYFADNADLMINMKKETLEEAGLRLYPRLINDPYNPTEDDNEEDRNTWIKGANWQAEEMYSEEEVIELLNKREDYINQTSSILDYTSTKEWFEQFKKK